MASKRRGGFRAPELRGTLGTLLRTTTGVVRDALERGAREGRARLDSARASRRRHDALADLGELVLDLIRRGEIDLAELPEARDLVRELDELDDGPDPAAEATAPEPPRPSSRRRFDDRGHRDRDDSDGTVASGASPRPGRPTVPDRPDRPRSAAESASSRAPTKPMRSTWRPSSDDPDRRSRVERWDAAHTFPISRSDLGSSLRGDPERERAERSERGERPERPAAGDRPERPATADRPDRSDRPDRDTERDRSDRRSPLLPRDPAHKGGISFDDEDDLADYMHPDDVPAKTPPPDPDDHDA